MATSDPGAFGVRTIATWHPQAPYQTVGGSSGGSGAALAADFCSAALGTDTGGSIRIPAACCAVAGLKPTRGRVSTKGVRPLVWSLDHGGPMARSVADLTDLQRTLDPRFHHTQHGDPNGFVVGHDTVGGSHNELSELTGWKQFYNPFQWPCAHFLRRKLNRNVISNSNKFIT